MPKPRAWSLPSLHTFSDCMDERVHYPLRVLPLVSSLFASVWTLGGNMVEAAEYQPLSGNTRSSANYQEYFLQSSILDTSCGKLVDRLQGLCDNVPKEQFADHEKTFVIKNAANNASAMVKACKALDKPDAPWQMKYIGTTESGDRAKGSLIRSCVTVSASKDPSNFLKELGFRHQYELVTKGYFFRKGRIKITIAKLHKLPSAQEPGKLDSISNSHLVEVSIFAPAGQEKAGEEVRQFCEHLRPIITFDVDHRKIQQMQSS